MKHLFASLVYLLSLVCGAGAFGAQARLEVFGPASRGVLNSTYRPILPHHINGLTRDSKVGFDLGYRGQSNSFVDAKSSLTGADFFVYGSVPLFALARKARPSGILVKVSSRSSKDIISYRNFEWEDEKSTDNLLADFGFVIAPSSYYMFSVQATIDQRNETNKLSSERELDGELVERRQTQNKSSTSFYAEYGYRLKLSRETSVGIVYKPGYYSQNGTHIKEENSFINESTVEEYNDVAYSQGFFSIGVKTRAKSISMMLGVDRFFAVKKKGETGGELLETDSSNLGIAAEYRIKAANKKSWIPRVGFQAQSSGESKFSLGVSLLAGNFEADLAATSAQGSTETSKKSEVKVMLGLGYRIRAEREQENVL